jgi:hypothetical protein
VFRVDPSLFLLMGGSWFYRTDGYRSRRYCLAQLRQKPFDIHVYKTVRAGLGTRLLHRAIEEATEAGFDTLVIDRATMGAKPFYDKTLARLADQGVIASHRVDKMPDEIGFHSYRYTVGLKGAEEQGL